jgi:hypothetical protein
VLVEGDPDVDARQQPCQLRLALLEWQRPKVLAVEFRADSVNITADGWVSVSVTICDESDGCTMLPGSIRRTPMRPSLGATTEVQSRFVCAVSIVARSASIIAMT